MLSQLLSPFRNKAQELKLRKVEGHSLYYYSGCPFCFRVQVALKINGLEMEMRNIHHDSKHRQDLLGGGGRTMVPCLRIEKNGKIEWMYESGDIVDYLKTIAQ